ncbi:hypothetical protein B0H11DRAFT_2225205 [Mycena galericulata]|nr:hypothetical protein B0H11DRAFT_2225205 [Mycena galericulata]
MVWVSNYASVSIVASVTGGDSGDFTLYPKQNETWAQNHWGRDGAETITITWAGGKTTSFQIEKDDHVLVWDDAYGVEIASAYSVYVEQCCTNLDAISYSALTVYTNEGNANTSILDPAFVQWMDNNDGDWSQGQADCSSASSALVLRGKSSVNKPASTTSSTGAQATPTTGGAARTRHQGCSFIFALAAAVIIGQMVWSREI